MPQQQQQAQQQRPSQTQQPAAPAQTNGESRPSLVRHASQQAAQQAARHASQQAEHSKFAIQIGGDNSNSSNGLSEMDENRAPTKKASRNSLASPLPSETPGAGVQKNFHHQVRDHASKVTIGKKTERAVQIVQNEIAPEVLEKKLKQLFDVLANIDTGLVDRKEFLQALEDTGLKINIDPRLAFIKKLASNQQVQQLDFDRFSEYVRPGFEIVYRALSGDIVIPDFDDFSLSCEKIIAKCQNPPEAVTLCTVDGQLFHAGSSSEDTVCLHEIGYAILYLIARQDLGRDKVHKYIGREYSGMVGDAISLTDEGIPHNPLTDLGAITSAALIMPTKTNTERYSYIQGLIKRMAGGLKVHFSNDLYSKKRENMFREEAMAFFLKEKNNLFDVEETLNLYDQVYSIEMSFQALSVVASTIANFGVCPLTGDKVFDPATVRDLLAMMYVAGMDLGSGEFAFKVGFPAKNALSGVVMAIVPGVMGISVYDYEESQQGKLENISMLEFFLEFSYNFPFGTKATHTNVQLDHSNEEEGATVNRFDPRSQHAAVMAGLWTQITEAIHGGDHAIEEFETLGPQILKMTDYYDRTLLHLAALYSKNPGLIRFLLERGADTTAEDLFGKVPKDYINSSNAEALAAFEGAAANADDNGALERGPSAMPRQARMF